MSEAPLNQGDLKMRTRTVLGSYTSSKPSPASVEYDNDSHAL